LHSDEPVGITLIRTLLSCDEGKLGHTFITKMLLGDKMDLASHLSPAIQLNFKLLAVLGRGSFSTVFLAEEQTSGSSVALKNAVQSLSFIGRSHNEALPAVNYLNKECDLLRKFSGVSNKLPYLYDNGWSCQTKTYLPFLPIGVALPMYAASLKKQSRITSAQQLSENLKEALAAALSFGYCHSDIRPQNVVYAGDVFVLIDWRLARREGDALHLYRGGLRFYHDDIVRGRATAFCNRYDFASVAYIVFAFQEGNPNLDVPWALLPGEKLIEKRTELCPVYEV
jgi:serine/threonine protein kinase